MGINLYPDQEDAVKRMKNGCILCGEVGSGKSITALAYYFQQQGGKLNPYKRANDILIKDLYIITTAKKRDDMDWEKEMSPFLLSVHPETNLYSNKVVVDSWNNIKKYKDVKGAFFIFDEQRVVGKGPWVTSFIKISRNNDWILLSATPGDKWEDYAPVFIANGFYKNRTEFNDRHMIFNYFAGYPQATGKYREEGRLIRQRNQILVDLDCSKSTITHHNDVVVQYDKRMYMDVIKSRWNPFKDEPIVNASEFCLTLRRIVNTDPTRVNAVRMIASTKDKVIIFYNYDYELNILRSIDYGPDVVIAEWNGHKHEPIPDSKYWVYLVQYNAGSEGWNCTQTDTIIFYSQNYSYRTMVQAAGRINRRNTPFIDLYFFHLKSKSSIDSAISAAIKRKKKFNEKRFYGA